MDKKYITEVNTRVGYFTFARNIDLTIMQTENSSRVGVIVLWVMTGNSRLSDKTKTKQRQGRKSL